MSYLVILDPGRPILAGHIEVDRTDRDQFAASGTGRSLQLDQCPDLAGHVFSNGVQMRFRSRLYRLGLSGFGAALTQSYKYGNPFASNRNLPGESGISVRPPKCATTPGSASGSTGQEPNPDGDPYRLGLICGDVANSCFHAMRFCR